MNKLKYIFWALAFSLTAYACSDDDDSGSIHPFKEGIAEKLVSPEASVAAVNVYNYLQEGYGERVLSGTMANYSTNIKEAEWVFGKTGKWPVIAGMDFIDHTRGWGDDAALVVNAKEWWRNRGIVTLMWHWRDPLKNTDEFYSTPQGNGGGYATFDVSKVTDANSPEYAAILADIDVIAGPLKELKEAGVPVLWRPLHEASGGWFWWGAKGAEPCKALWKLLFGRLVNTHGLNNLIWVWTSNGKDADWYPGDEYVDVVGADIYDTSEVSFLTYWGNVKNATGGKKLIALTECGKMPVAESMFTEGHPWAWMMPWNGDYTENEDINGETAWTALFKDKRIITRDMMPDLK